MSRLSEGRSKVQRRMKGRREKSSRTELAENGGQCVRNELRIVIKEKKTSGGEGEGLRKKNESLNLPNRTVVDSLCPSIYNTLLLFRLLRRTGFLLPPHVQTIAHTKHNFQ